MPSPAYHDITCSRARHSVVLKAIHAWLSENQFTRDHTGSELVLKAAKGSCWSFRSQTQAREMKILVRPEFGLTIISIYHSTPRIGFMLGLMDSAMLQDETESLIHAIHSLPEMS